MKTIGLLRTNFTMEQDFYNGRLTNRYGFDVLIPAKTDRDVMHCIIYDELCLGKITDASRQEFLRIIKNLHQQGAHGIIEVCTEIVILVQQHHTDIPLFDTTMIHARAAVAQALERC